MMKRLTTVLLLIGSLATPACTERAPSATAPAPAPPVAAEESPLPPAEPPAAPAATAAPLEPDDPDAPEVWMRDVHATEAVTDLPGLFAAELAEAKAAGDQVIVVFTADWCSPCRVIKRFLSESGSCRRSVVGGRFLFIDVDEWRGPAHRLIPGVDPRKLPMLARVDYDGALVHVARGSEVGLLSAKEAGENLKRMIAGEAPITPNWDDRKDEKTALLRAQAARTKEAAGALEPAEVEVTRRPEGEAGVWELTLTLRTGDSRMRWFVIPRDLSTPLREKPAVTGWEVHNPTEHVRYTYFRYTGDRSFDVVPVGRTGRLVLEGYQVQGPAEAKSLEIWELNQLKVGGNVSQFDRKVPYDLHLKKAGATRVIRSGAEPLDVELVVRKRHELSL